MEVSAEVGGRDERRPGGERDSPWRVVERLRGTIALADGWRSSGAAASALSLLAGERWREV